MHPFKRVLAWNSPGPSFPRYKGLFTTGSSLGRGARVLSASCVPFLNNRRVLPDRVTARCTHWPRCSPSGAEIGSE